MADFGIYWKNFARERQQGDWPCTRWFTNSARLGRHLSPEDRLWLFTSGDACAMPESKLGYLVEIFIVQEVGKNPGTNAAYPPADFKYAIQGDPARCVAVGPPLLVDRLIREDESEARLSIGTARQGPWRLKEGMAATLEDRLRLERRDLFERIVTGDEG